MSIVKGPQKRLADDQNADKLVHGEGYLLEFYLYDTPRGDFHGVAKCMAVEG